MKQRFSSCVAGDFGGWNVSTLYVLENGTVWKQMSGDLAPHYSYRPIAVLWEDGERTFLEVEDAGMKEVVPALLDPDKGADIIGLLAFDPESASVLARLVNSDVYRDLMDAQALEEHDAVSS